MFRNHSSHFGLSIPGEVLHQERKLAVNSIGVQCHQVVKCNPNEVLLPSYDEYKLSSLLDAGITLERAHTDMNNGINQSDIDLFNKIVEQDDNQE